MPKAEFFTRSPQLAFLRQFVEENSNRDFERSDVGNRFKALDRYCAEHFPTEERGGWQGPLMLGGALLRHTPPHIIFAVSAIYAELSRDHVEPTTFLSAPLNRSGSTAIQFEPTEGFQVMDRDREVAPMTDLLVLIPVKAPLPWIVDFYGIPEVKADVIPIGWHAAAQSRSTAKCSGLLFLHEPSGKVLDPMAPMTFDDQRRNFIEPILNTKVDRHVERLVEFVGTPLDVFESNHSNAKRVLEAYLAKGL